MVLFLKYFFQESVHKRCWYSGFNEFVCFQLYWRVCFFASFHESFDGFSSFPWENYPSARFLLIVVWFDYAPWFVVHCGCFGFCGALLGYVVFEEFEAFSPVSNL